MKRFLIIPFILLFFASTGWCAPYTINSGTQVGNLDPFAFGTDDLSMYPGGGSSPEAEAAWIEDMTGLETYLKYDQNGSEAGVMLADGETSIYAFALNDEPDYFLIKWGAGGNTGDSNTEYVIWTLWDNTIEPDRNWAVFDIDDSGLYDEGWEIKNIGAFSHYGETGGDVPVPEPATMFLLGAGLLGLAGASRRKLLKKS